MGLPNLRHAWGYFVDTRDFKSAGGALRAPLEPGVGKTLADGTK